MSLAAVVVSAALVPEANCRGAYAQDSEGTPSTNERKHNKASNCVTVVLTKKMAMMAVGDGGQNGDDGDQSS